MTAALEHLFNRLRNEGYPAALMGGIYADKPGYHNQRANLPGSDYSVQRPDDQTGSDWDPAGLDITLHNPSDMQRITQRLLDLTAAGDPRIQILREFFGTVDGWNVVGRDVRDNRPITSDDSHLWHCHISSYRLYANSHSAMDELATAILGGIAPPLPPIVEDDEMAFRVYQDPRSPGQWAIGADWAIGMASSDQAAIWLTLPDCADPQPVVIDEAHWDQLTRRIPPNRWAATGGLQA